MNHSVQYPTFAQAYELRFDSLFIEGRGLSFPCDAAGRVDLDALSERARQNYLRARAVIGREYRTPAVLSRNDGPLPSALICTAAGRSPAGLH